MITQTPALQHVGFSFRGWETPYSNMQCLQRPNALSLFSMQRFAVCSLQFVSPGGERELNLHIEIFFNFSIPMSGEIKGGLHFLA